MWKRLMGMMGFAVVALVASWSLAGERAKFSRSYAQEALPEGQVPRVIKGHPRLLIRSEPWKGGLSVGQLRARARSEPWARDFTKRSAQRPKSGPAWAIRCLATGDGSLVPDIVKELMEVRYWPGSLTNICLQYDWMCSSPAFTADQKRALADKIARDAHKAAATGRRYSDMWSHYGYRAPCDLLIAGLALHGDHPDARKFISWGMGYFKRNFFRGWQRTGGGWQGGGHAYYRYAGDPLALAIACWASATEEDIFEVIRRDYGNWLQEHMYFLMYQMLPDKTRVDSTGFDYAPGRAIMNPVTIMLIARGYRNPDGYAFLRWLGLEPRRNWRFWLKDVLLYDKETDGKKPSFTRTLQPTKLWGRDGFGYLQMRSNGWEPDSTVVEFKCGDYFWSHNFLSQNSFCIYHRGRLAIQSGLYDVYGGNHFDHYYSKTISGNGMLVLQPGEFTWTPIRRKHSQDVDQQGFLPEAGGQRVVAWGAETCFTFDEYLSRMDSKQHFETGNITAFEHAPDFSYSYVCGDATNAYSNPHYAYRAKGRANKPKIALFTRSLAYLARKHLVVFDRVNALDPGYRKAWLLHSISKPEVSGKLISAQVPGHIEDFDGDVVTITYTGGKMATPEKTGRLFVRTFLPKAHYIRRIGGKGYEFYANGKNRPIARQPASYCKQETGSWRIEVSPAKPAKFGVFLHLLYPCERSATKMPPAEMIAADGEKMVGIAVDGWVVMFGRLGEADGEVGYRSPGAAQHLVVDLKRRAQYRITGAVGGTRVARASDEGCLRFATERAGRVSIAPIASAGDEQ